MPEFFKIPLGLTIDEVSKNRKQHGSYKRVRKAKYFPFILFNSFFSLFNLILYGLILILFVFGEFSNITVIFLLNVSYSIILLIQKSKFYKSIENSENKSHLQQNVLRQIGQRNQLNSIKISQIVVGDVIYLEGESEVIFNGEIIAQDYALFNESIVNGRSDLIDKNINDHVFANSTLISGRCFYKVTTLKSFNHISHIDLFSYFKDISNGVRYIAYSLLLILGIILIFTFELTISEDGNLNFGASITSLVPQCILFVYIISLFISLKKANKNNVLIKRFNALEALSATDVLCMDKTGTLTKNKLRVKYIFPLNQKTKERDILLLASLVNNLSDKNKSVVALIDYLKDIPGYSSLKKIKEIPSTNERRASICVFDEFSLIMGDPNILLPIDHHILKNVEKFRNESYRVFIFGSYGEEKKFNPLSLIVIEDSVRDEIASELFNLTKNPIELKILSGDLDFPVMSIASKLQSGFDSKAISGSELTNLNDMELERASMLHNVFSQLTQFQKKVIVLVLKKKNLNITMLGDGYNDILALKEANLGMTMKDSPGAIKVSSDLIFESNNFAYLNQLFEDGKILSTKINNIFNLYLCKNLSLMALIAFTSIIGFGYLFDPKQIALADFLVLEIPALILSFTDKSQKKMTFGKTVILSAKISVMNIFILISGFEIFKLENLSTDMMRSAMLILSIVIGMVNIILIYNDKYLLKQIADDELVILTVGGIFVFLVCDMTIPIIRDYFGLIPLSIFNFILVILLSIFGMFLYIILSDLKRVSGAYNNFFKLTPIDSKIFNSNSIN